MISPLAQPTCMSPSRHLAVNAPLVFVLAFTTGGNTYLITLDGNILTL